MYFQSFKSPFGDLTLFAEDEAIVVLEFGKGPDGDSSPLLKEARSQLEAYFRGKLQEFDLPLNTRGTPFQKAVWKLMLEIPYGSTRSYGELAGDLKSAARAVGGACGKNPIPIIVPCHRILAANHKIGGFSGGTGTDTKISLLRLEGVDL
ncbi:MAG: methylated-DNA--[protein]-cysteine S-methyltransferase [Rhodospirillales bacterium]|nr:methylated-DNA--[protein]-cysteine S-methyltransferase [Rhodospirillales bacterium]